MISAMDIQIAAYNLRPGMVGWASDTYESIRWRCDDPPTKEEVMEEALKVSIQNAFGEIRIVRNQRLIESDWTQILDAPVDAKAWAKYRQELRDLPETIKDPTTTIVWPTPPN